VTVYCLVRESSQSKAYQRLKKELTEANLWYVQSVARNGRSFLALYSLKTRSKLALYSFYTRSFLALYSLFPRSKLAILAISSFFISSLFFYYYTQPHGDTTNTSLIEYLFSPTPQKSTTNRTCVFFFFFFVVAIPYAVLSFRTWRILLISFLNKPCANNYYPGAMKEPPILSYVYL
jgi:hypothetical protein